MKKFSLDSAVLPAGRAAAFVGLLLTARAAADVIGYDGFNYPAGPAAGKGAGVHWDWDNTVSPGHTGRVSQWEAIYNTPGFSGGKLVTSESGAKRRYHGVLAADEISSAVNETSLDRAVYYKVVMSVGTGVNWCGISSFDFGSERLFWGLFPDGSGKFSIYDQNTFTPLSVSAVSVIPGTTYTLVAKLDFSANVVRLYINPDLTAPESSAVPAVTATYAATWWSTGVRLASGGAGTVGWDDLVVASSWDSLRPFVVNTAVDEANVPAGPNLSLREAVRDAAVLGGENLITFAPALAGQTLALGSEISVADTGGGSVVDSSALSAPVTVSDGAAVSYRLFNVAAGSTFGLSGLTLADGGGSGFLSGGEGGAVRNLGNFTARSCVFRGNSAQNGGAVMSQGTSMTLSGCLFETNNANNGGAVYANQLVPCEMVDSQFRGNTAISGGGVYNNFNGAIRRTSFSGNTASTSGGAMFSAGVGTGTGGAEFLLSECDLSGNVSASGGAVGHNMSILNLERCTVSGNQATVLGGGVASSSIGNVGTLNLTLTTVAENTAPDGAGILSGNPVFLTHCTVSGNGATAGGGGLDLPAGGGPATIRNSILYGNSAPALQGADVRNRSVLSRVGVNMVGNSVNSGSGSDSGLAALTESPLLTPLGHYGGRTMTMLPMTHSLALDVVTAGLAVPGLTTDQRGLPRSAAGRVGGASLPDIGAVERNVTWVTTLADEFDTPVSGAQVSLREALRDAPGGEISFSSSAFAPTNRRLELSAARGELVISKDVNLDGTEFALGAIIEAAAGSTQRILTNPAERQLGLIRMQVKSGRGGGAVLPGLGGGILNQGILTLVEATVMHNEAPEAGGGIHSEGEAHLHRSNVSDNLAGTLGGGLSNFPGKVMTLTSSCVANNSSLNGAGISSGGSLKLVHCTVAFNGASVQGGGVEAFGGSMEITNSIVSDNFSPAGTGADIWNNAVLTRTGHNLVGHLETAGAGSLTGTGTVSSLDPLLGLPLDMDGSTQSCGLRPGSPARNAALVLNPPVLVDQRNFPILNAPDIGSYESGLLRFATMVPYLVETLPPLAWDADEDFDGDGVTNRSEWAGLTDPADPRDCLRVAAITGAGPGLLSISFPSKDGRAYILESSTTMAAGSWSMELPMFILGDGTVRQFTVSAPAAGVPRRFYRVLVSTGG
ncbi:MAG: hypothetical protein JWL81_2463 [Verrucomicrobiales bacterium]|nr:hypothetical protein [Verrucomicrobiales bacterium]